MPIGVREPWPTPSTPAHFYVHRLNTQWDSPIKSSAGLPRAVDLYRRILGAAEDGSVTIASVGVLSNLAELLRSPPDEHSTLWGTELVRHKVHLLTIMGGSYPTGEECNFCGDRKSSAYVVDSLPVDLRVQTADCTSVGPTLGG